MVRVMYANRFVFVMEKGWLAVIRIWLLYANSPIFDVLYLSFNFEMSPCGPSNKNPALGEMETFWGCPRARCKATRGVPGPRARRKFVLAWSNPRAKWRVRSRVVRAFVDGLQRPLG
jgi:hypothetical protein